uniref:UBIQUITIN_CONJUGAT_2 domain-containing protein n=1 Tax=Rhabditophanes sp. KR3021 TaxID=114890 RepID=A0AC35UF50_9BILA
MGSSISSSSPSETDIQANMGENIVHWLNEKPIKLTMMLKITKILNDASPEEKLEFYEAGVLGKLFELLGVEGDISTRENGEHRVSLTRNGSEGIDAKQMKKKAESDKNRGTGERTKRIAKELASMANSLPINASNSIFVCVDETRCDILKVLISGPDDTPYENGLFEFDVAFPNSYPFSPPKCAFLTTGNNAVRFNPNLYSDGKICLSILGTWEGRPEEKWNPYCSLLQVLISIQGLIFVKEPYFNEPGFEKYQGSEKGDMFSKKYNLQIEHATLVYAIKDQMQKNGKNQDPFDDVKRKFFWLKRYQIIKKCEKWIIEMRKEMNEINNNPKRRDSYCFEQIYNPVVQEKMIQNLIIDLKKLQCPLGLEDLVKDESK